MKTNIKTKFISFILGTVLLLTGCNNAGGGSKSGAVNIRNITAKTCENQVEVVKKTARRANDQTSDENYVLIYKDENDIQLTVQLDNPKGESIDALEIACDDTGAEILVDGQYKSMNVSSNGRVVNWAQEDPYEKTFYMRTISEDDLTTVRINDIKVNGQWQNKGLSNNELKVFKLGEEDMSTTFVTNTTEYYECVINYGANISNLVVTGGEWVSTNHYRMTHDGVMKLDYEYTFAGIARHWTEERNIELLSLERDKLHFGNDSISSYPSDGDWYIDNLSISGTDFEKFDIHISYNADIFYMSSYSPAVAGANNIEARLVFKNCNLDEIDDFSKVNLFVNNIGVQLN